MLSVLFNLFQIVREQWSWFGTGVHHNGYQWVMVGGEAVSSGLLGVHRVSGTRDGDSSGYG
jgi:hypothetical protein